MSKSSTKEFIVFLGEMFEETERTTVNIEEQMKPQEMIDVIKAFEDGKKIEVSLQECEDWIPAIIPSWNFGICNYRIAPTQTKALYKYLLRRNGSSHYSETELFYSDIIDVAKDYEKCDCTIIGRIDHSKVLV